MPQRHRRLASLLRVFLLSVLALQGCDDAAAGSPTTADSATSADSTSGTDVATSQTDAASAETATGPVDLYPGQRPPPKLAACFANPACGTPLVVAHRGEDSGAPENSLAAILGSPAKGADVVEIDIRQTKDGQLILMHDGDFDRTTDAEELFPGVSRDVGDLTWAEVQTLTLTDPTGGCDGPGPTIDPGRCRVPTLQQAVLTAKGKVLLMLDYKTGDHLAIAKVVADAGALDTVYFFDSSLDKLAQIQQAYPGFVVMPRADDAATTKALFVPHYPVIHIDQGYLADTADAATTAGHKLFLNVFVPADLYYKAAAEGDDTALPLAEASVHELLTGGARLLQTDRASQLRKTVDAWRAAQ
jgi:glycerophosphoryl diester phosphodiesterase